MSKNNDFNMRVIDMMMAVDANPNADPERKRAVLKAMSDNLTTSTPTARHRAKKKPFWKRLFGN